MQYFIVYRFVSKRKRQVVFEQYFCVASFIWVREYLLWSNFFAVKMFTVIFICGNVLLRITGKIIKSPNKIRTLKNFVPHGILRPWVLVRSHESNPRRNDRKSSALTPSIPNSRYSCTRFQSLSVFVFGFWILIVRGVPKLRIPDSTSKIFLTLGSGFPGMLSRLTTHHTMILYRDETSRFPLGVTKTKTQKRRPKT